MIFRIFGLITLWLGIMFSHAAETTLPVFKHYSYKEFRAPSVMWGMVQDSKGLIYFANNDGVLTFDGARWVLIPLPNKVKALAIDGKDNVYVGCDGDFGMLVPRDDAPTLSFLSFKSGLKDKPKGVCSITKVYATNVGVYFLSSDAELFVQEPTKRQPAVTVYQLSVDEIMGVGVIGEQLFVNYKSEGFRPFDKGELKNEGSLPGLKEKFITAVLPTAKDEYVIVTDIDGLFKFANGGVVPLPTGADAALKKSGVYGATVLRSGNIALATMSDGVYIVSPTGQFIQAINRTTNFPYNDLYSIFTDREGGLWIGHAQGLTYAAPDLPVQTFVRLPGMSGKITGITTGANKTYVTTITGSYLVDTFNPTRFTTVQGLSDVECYSLTNAGGKIYAATANGLFNISGGTATPVVKDRLALILLASTKNDGWLYCGFDNGVSIVSPTGKSNEIKDLKIDPNSFYEDNDGVLWIGTNSQGVVRIDNPTGDSPKVERFKAAQGLTDGYVKVYNFGSKLIAQTPDGLYQLDGTKFVRQSGLSTLFPGKNFRFTTDTDGRVWVYNLDGARVGKPNGDAFVFDTLALPNLIGEEPSVIYPTDNTIWVAYNDQLVKFSKNGVLPKYFPKIIIRQVVIGRDSLVQDGFFWDEQGEYQSGQTDVFRPEIKYSLNTVTFKVGMSSFLNSGVNQFQFYLEGFDETWRDWSNKAEITYSNLSEKSYKLRIRGRNAIGQITPEETYEFVIKAPWYRTIVAYFAYALLLGGIVYGAITLNARRLEKQNQLLEATVQERTREVNKQKEELLAQKAQLQSTLDELQTTQNQLVQSEKMAALGQLIAGVAHEINTPIGAINAASTNLTKGLPAILQKMPDVVMHLNPELTQYFNNLIEASLNITGSLTSREERTFTKEIGTQLEAQAVANASKVARELVQAGLVSGIDTFVPLFKSENAPKFIDLASTIGKFKVNLSNIQLAVAKTQKIVFALKTFSHRQVEEKPVDVNIVENIETVLTIYHNQIKYGINIFTDFAPDLPIIKGFPDELNQVWTNILHNAIQAMNNKGDFKIEAKRQGEYIEVRLTDNGPGIPDHIKDKIFEPFFTTKGAGEGSGLGLDICRKIVAKHHGSIGVDSEPGRTTFIIRLKIDLPENTTEQTI